MQAGKTFAYLLSRAKQFAGRSAGLVGQAAERRMISDGKEEVWPASIFLPENLVHAKSSFSGSLEDAILNATTTHVHHKALSLCRITDALYINGAIYTKSGVSFVGKHKAPLKYAEKSIKEAVLCSSPSGSIYFGDWLFSDNILDGLAISLDLPRVKSPPKGIFPHRPRIGEILGISEMPEGEALCIDTLWIADDVGYGEDKIRRLISIRENLRNASNLETVDQPVFLQRGSLGRDRGAIENYGALGEFLQKHKFKVLDPSQMSFDQIMAEVFNAPIVMGVEGSQLSYGILGLREGGALIAIQPPTRFQSSFRPRCVAVNVQFGFVVGIESGSGFRIPIADLERITEMAAAP